jgi:hypothetical protein
MKRELPRQGRQLQKLADLADLTLRRECRNRLFQHPLGPKSFRKSLFKNKLQSGFAETFSPHEDFGDLKLR